MPRTTGVEEADKPKGLGRGKWSVVRKVRLPDTEIVLVAVSDGKGWRVRAEGSALFQAMEFHGPLPKIALDQAESFVRRLMIAPPAD